MSLRVSGLDVVKETVSTELRVGVLEKIVAHLLQRSPGALSNSDLERFREQTKQELQAKYPELGLKFTGP